MTVFNILLLGIWVLSTAIIGALATAVVLRRLRSRGVEQVVRDDGPESHLSKAGTPTMGGLLIVFSSVVSTLLWSDLTNSFVWIMLFVIIGYGLVGFVACRFVKSSRCSSCWRSSPVCWFTPARIFPPRSPFRF